MTGIETSTDFLHRSRTLIRFGSIANVSPTRRSCSRAISYGFSRRWVGTSAVVIRLLPAWLGRWRAGVYASGEGAVSESGSRRPPPRRARRAAGRRRAACRRRAASVPPRGPRPVSPNAYRPGSTSRSRASTPSRSPAAPQLHVEPRDRTQLAAPGQVAHLAGLHGQDHGSAVRGTEASSGQRDGRRSAPSPESAAPPPTGRRSWPPPETSSRARPFDRAEPARKERDTRGQRHEALLSRPQPQPGGLGRHRDAGDALRRRRHRDGDRTRGDVPDRDPADGSPARLVGRAEADGGRVRDRPRRRSPPRDRPRPRPGPRPGSGRTRTAVPTSAPFRAAASSSGRAWASTAAAPPASAAAALEPLIVP